MEIKTECKKCEKEHEIELRKTGSIDSIILVYKCSTCGTLNLVGEIK